MNGKTIVRGTLTFTQLLDGSYVCEQLRDIPPNFNQRYTKDGVETALAGYFSLMRASATQNFTERSKHNPKDERKRLGEEAFDRVRSEISLFIRQLTPFQQFLFWLSTWWFKHPAIEAAEVHFEKEFTEAGNELLKQFLVPLLPEQVRNTVEGMRCANVALKGEHFAFLFDDGKGTRRIVTNTQLFEIHGVRGYIYLDVLPDGQPFTRSVCDNRDGKRAFFDGKRLMTHNRFATCGPPMIALNRGYMVDSGEYGHHVTIVNGTMFREIMYQPDPEMRRTQVLGDGGVTLDGRKLHPLGTFLPSSILLLETGFALYNWSTFVPDTAPRYNKIMVVDDDVSWIGQVRETFGNTIPTIVECCTTNAGTALEQILIENPEVVLLDIHFTPEERFEGLWIARQLLARGGFAGRIFLTSAHHEEDLKALATLIKNSVATPGKSLLELEKLLIDKP